MQTLMTALVVAVLDAAFAISYYWNVLGANTPARVFKSIAAGWLGKAAYTGGNEVLALGIVSHYLVALCWTLSYIIVVRKLPIVANMVRTTGGQIAVGFAFGALGYLFMDFIIIPLSHAGQQSPASWRFYGMVAWHMVGVGVPIVMLTERAPVRVPVLAAR
jgi:uncharacterized membrane protein YagU involved in acid resistance